MLLIKPLNIVIKFNLVRICDKLLSDKQTI